ncbi:MAG: NnrU family protein [Granulosicoccus sp.]
MLLLIVGLALFLGIHSFRMLASSKRSEILDSRGEGVYKGVYSLVSLAGLVLLIVGYGQARLSPVLIWQPPAFMSHLAALLVLAAFILLAAAYVPGNHIKARVGHPMVLAVKIWAFAHLLSNGTVADVILFGSFLVWAIVNYVLSKKRDRLAGVSYQPVSGISRDAIVVVVGVLAWLVIAMWLHVRLIGVSPFSL